MLRECGKLWESLVNLDWLCSMLKDWALLWERMLKVWENVFNVEKVWKSVAKFRECGKSCESVKSVAKAKKVCRKCELLLFFMDFWCRGWGLKVFPCTALLLSKRHVQLRGKIISKSYKYKCLLFSAIKYNWPCKIIQDNFKGIGVLASFIKSHMDQE